MIGKEGVVVAIDKTKYWSFAIDDEEFYTPALYMRKEDAINAGMEDARDDRWQNAVCRTGECV